MPFTFEKAPIEGLVIIKPRVFRDARGYFLETYKKSDFTANGIDLEFVQDNHSYSEKGVLRGLHFQKDPFAQGKLVRVISGKVWDVAVDLRKASPTYNQWYGLELSGDNNTMFYIPPGFAHGFLTLSEHAHFHYKCTNEYSPEHDAGIIWNDPDIGVQWPLDNVQLSEKDKALPQLEEAYL